MTQQLVILAGGLLTAGKDVFADHLVDNHGFVKLGMSDTLAEALRRLNPIIPRVWAPDEFGAVHVEMQRYQDLWQDPYMTYTYAKQEPEVRRLLQVLGTEVGRELFGQNFWVDMAKKKILEQLEQGAAGVVLTGARFPNEVQLADHLNVMSSTRAIATTVWVRRPGIEQGTHASEASVSAEDFEYVLENDGTLEELPAKADALLERIRGDYAAG